MTTHHPNELQDTTTDTRLDRGADTGGGDDADAGTLASMRDHLGAQVSAGAQGAQDAAAAAGQQVGDTISSGTQEGVRFVRENPGVAMAGAVGLGVLIGLALRGRP